MKTTDGKSREHYQHLFSSLLVFVPDREVTIAQYEPEAGDEVQVGNSVEVRGLVNGDNSVQFGDLNRFEGEFDKGTYE